MVDAKEDCNEGKVFTGVSNVATRDKTLTYCKELGMSQLALDTATAGFTSECANDRITIRGRYRCFRNFYRLQDGS